MWQITDYLATAETNHFRAQVDLRFPQRGIHKLVIDGRELTGASVLGIALDNAPLDASEEIEPEQIEPEQIADCYVRGRDLVVTYDQTNQRPNQTQLYWRILDLDPAICGFELIYSLQTSLWETEPVASLRTVVPASSVRYLRKRDDAKFDELNLSAKQDSPRTTNSAFAAIIRPANCDLSYIELLDPTEHGNSRFRFAAAGEASVRLNYEIYADRLEKGVIRRGRIRGLFVTRANDEPSALACLEQLTNAAPPLTT